MNYPAPEPSPAMPATRWIQNNATALALGIALCWSASAGAQVVRCTDPATGKVTYTRLPHISPPSSLFPQGKLADSDL